MKGRHVPCTVARVVLEAFHLVQLDDENEDDIGEAPETRDLSITKPELTRCGSGKKSKDIIFFLIP